MAEDSGIEDAELKESSGINHLSVSLITQTDWWILY
jgi:hypothetical protein